MYLGIKRDRSLTFRQQQDGISAKTTARVAVIRRFACTTWSASIKSSHISTQALVFSTAEYCALVWCWNSHIKKLDTILNNDKRTIFGCLHATPLNQLPILTSISTPTLPRGAAVLALSWKATNYEELFHQTITEIPKLTCLKSRRSFS